MGSSCSTAQKTNRSYQTSSPINGLPLIDEETNVKVVDSSFSVKNSEIGSKEEAFFESQPWLDSDCDDDFFSVNGDFTPSRGSTPNNQSSILSRAKSNETIALDKFPDFEPSPSPTGRKRLSDLFRETQEPIAYEGKQETNGEQTPPLQTNSDDTPKRADLMSSGKLTPSSEAKNKSKAGRKATQCCMPSLSLSQSRSETK